MIFFYARTTPRPRRRRCLSARDSNRPTAPARLQIEDQLHRGQPAGHPEEVAFMHQHPEPVRHQRQQRHAHAPSVRRARPQVGKCFRRPGVVFPLVFQTKRRTKPFAIVCAGSEPKRRHVPDVQQRTERLSGTFGLHRPAAARFPRRVFQFRNNNSSDRL